MLSDPPRSLHRWIVLVVLLSASCDGRDRAVVSHTVVLAEMGLILYAEADGSVHGFDLDGRVDDLPAPESCNKVDFTSPDGTPGVDNQISLFGPIVDLFGTDALALIQVAINDGALLMLVQFEGLDSFENDNDVTVRFVLGAGPTDIGNDGLLVPGQSFDMNPGYNSIEIRHQRVVDGHMDGSTDETLVLPVRVLDTSFDLPVVAAHFSFDFDGDTGEVAGMMGGGVPIRTLIDDVILRIEGGQDVAPIATLTLSRMGDLAPNSTGGCDQVSAAMIVHGVTAFLLPTDDAAR